MEKLKILAGMFLFIFIINFISSSNVPIWVRPLDSGGNLQFGDVSSYNFSFDTSNNCLNSIFSHFENKQTSLMTADFFINITTPSSVSAIPKFICIYRNNGLWTTISLSNGYFDKIYADSLNVTNNVSGDWFIGKVNYSNVQNTPSFIENVSWNQSYANTLYAPNTTLGIQVLNNDSNSSAYWDNLNSYNATQMSESNGLLNILESWLTTFINSFGFLTSNDANLTYIINGI